MATLDHRTIRAADADAIIIGAGLNGLTCAAILASQKLRVLVLEAQEDTGGLHRIGEVVAGYHAPLYAHLAGPFDAALARSLKLTKYGLSVSQPRTGAIAAGPDGRHVYLDPFARRAGAALAQYSTADAKAFPVFSNGVRKLASGISEWVSEPPYVRATGRGAAGAALTDQSARQTVSALAWRSIGSLAEEAFETPLLQGGLALDAILGTGLGPFSPGTAALWLEKLAFETTRPDSLITVSGASLAHALSQAVRAAGAVIRTRAQVVDLIVDQAQVHGVMLERGETLFAPIVVSSLGPQSAFRWPSLKRAVAPDLLRRLPTNMNGQSVAKVHLALKGLPQWRGLEPGDLRSRLLICGGLDELQRGYLAAADGQLPEDLALEVTTPSLTDETLAPKGGHVVSVLAAIVPHAPQGGWSAMRDKLALKTISTLSAYAPDLAQRVLSVEVETPENIASACGGPVLWRAPGIGALHEANPYGTPVDGFYFCDHGTHPRAGGAGFNGRNCAEAILARMAARGGVPR